MTDRVALIITNKIDMHVDVVLAKIKQRGIQVFRWNIEDFPSAHKMGFHYDKYGRVSNAWISAEDRIVSLESVRAVW